MNLKTVSYAEFKVILEEKINSLPLRFAFNKEQLDELLKEWGFSREEFIKNVTKYAGGYILKTDLPVLKEFAKWQKESKAELFKRQDYL